MTETPPAGNPPPPDAAPRALVFREPEARDLPLPEYQTDGAAGVDLRAAIPEGETLTIAPGAWAVVPTGLRIALPPGCEAQVRPRSGLAARHGIGLLNAPGTIDEDYRGEIQVIAFNFGKADFGIRRGDRIAQMVFARVTRLAWQPADALPETRRGDGGFGHTGSR